MVGPVYIKLVNAQISETEGDLIFKVHLSLKTEKISDDIQTDNLVTGLVTFLSNL